MFDFEYTYDRSNSNIGWVSKRGECRFIMWYGVPKTLETAGGPWTLFLPCKDYWAQRHRCMASLIIFIPYMQVILFADPNWYNGPQLTRPTTEARCPKSFPNWKTLAIHFGLSLRLLTERIFQSGKLLDPIHVGTPFTSTTEKWVMDPTCTKYRSASDHQFAVMQDFVISIKKKRLENTWGPHM